ncbi:unnamed protein product [Penicillium manginii]
MDGLSSAASVIAVIQLAGSIVATCGGYIKGVKDAREDIIRLQHEVVSLKCILEKLADLLHGSNGFKLSTSRSLVEGINRCLEALKDLEDKIDPGKGRKLMRRLGRRALKWPIKRAEVERVVTDLERFKGLFTLSLQVDQTTFTICMAQTTDHMDQNLQLAKLPVARGAEFDSYADQHEEECLPGTRTEILRQIAGWAVSPEGKCIFWLNGMAGTGKSTISRTISRHFQRDRILGASFFFKRGEGDRGNPTRLIPTITKQLVLRIPQLLPGVQEAIQNNPEIAGKSLKEQFDKVLLQPLLDLKPFNQKIPTLAIVIDALDECENDNDKRVILQLLPQLQKPTALYLRIFLTSRPEVPIRLGFSRIENRDYQGLALHEIPAAVAEKDISMFLEERLANIRVTRDVPQGWPSDGNFESLLKMSSPLFISAATACRFIEDLKWEPAVRLQELLQNQAKYASKMEKTYMPILTQLLDDQEDDDSELLLKQFQKVVGAIVLLATPLSVNTLSRLLSIRARAISHQLDFFRSVLSIPSDGDLPVRILHLSFRDFLVNSKSKFRVDEQKTNEDIAAYCFTTMRSHLKKDICNLVSYGKHRADIDAHSIHHHLPTELQYSCRYWAHHLLQTTDPITEMNNAFSFLQRHFLHWMEAMSVLGLASEVVGTLNSLLSAMNLPRIKENWDSELQTLEGHSDVIHSVAFSPDGQLLASGSSDKTVCIWHALTGALRQTLEGHSDAVQSVAFSPDGQLLVSGSGDKTIRIWELATGALQQTLEGHSSEIWSVVFSHNGQLLGSGSFDKTVRLWDTATGELKRTLEGHSNWVLSIAFSHDSQILASGSRDGTLHLWNTTTGALLQTLEGHSSDVWSVAFSHNGQLLASGSFDKTVRLWDTATGALLRSLEGHAHVVQSVAFSPDGQLLVSGSADKTVRVWGTVTGALQQTLVGHFDWVQSVAFSPNKLILASGSFDKTIRLWDITMGENTEGFEGHSNMVQTVVFSPDGRHLASGSFDTTVRLWEITTGSLQLTIEGHTDGVHSLAFSPDGRLLASGSGDKTVRVWHTMTGALRQTLEGHSDTIQSVAFSPDGRHLASGSFDKTVRLWDITTGSIQQTLSSHSDAVQSVVFSPNGKLLASGSFDKTVRLWDSAKGTLRQTLRGHLSTVHSVAFSPDGQLLASSSSDKAVRLWSTFTGALRQILMVHGVVTKLQFSQDGTFITTNLGSLNIHSRSMIHAPLRKYLDISIQDRQWICINGEKTLWLPPEFRPTCSEVKEDTLALGHASGRVSFIGFND